MSRKVAAALIVALALASAGRGGGERVELVSRAQAVRRLEVACLAGQRAAQARLHGSHDRTAFFAALRANMETIVDRVGDVEPSRPARSAFDAYEATLRTRLDALAHVTAARSANLQKAISAQRTTYEAADRRAHEAIVALGARHVCV